MERELEKYAKVVLYAYPYLKTVGEDYAEHIRNRAVLSFDGRVAAERLAEYIAREIIEQKRLVALKEDVDKALGRLDEKERRLVEIRFFGKRRKWKEFLAAAASEKGWSERKYFRQQKKVGERIGALLCAVGVTRERFDRELAGVEMLARIAAMLDKPKV